MRQPLVSVVTPALNSAELIEDCISSVLDQDYPHIEYIVIDGGSTDGTLDIVRKYDDRLSFWISEPDNGQADAINKGLRRATGEIVSWLNSDDFLYPGALAAAVEAYLEDPHAPFYFGDGYRVRKSGRKISEFFPGAHVHFRRDALVFGLNCVLQPATFVRRAALERVGFLDHTLHYGFDTELWIELSALGQPRPIRKHLAASREYGETKTARGSFPRAEELRRIAERHAGVAATPGSISYYLDTLHRLATSRPDVFPEEYRSSIGAFWSDTARLLERYGAQPNGFPIPSPAELAIPDRTSVPKTGRLRVGVELRQVTRGLSGGIAVVLAGTLVELFRSRPDVDFVVFCTVFNRELLATDSPNVDFETLPLSGFFDELARIARGRRIDLLVRSYPTVEDVEFPLKRQIFVVPDVQHEAHPEFFDPASLELRRRAFLPVYQGAGAIMTISDFARATIAELSAEGSDVFVASPTVAPDFLGARSSDTTDEERGLVDGVDSYFFFPANLWPHKNHRRLIQAFRLFRKRTGSAAELVLTGSPRGWQELRAEHEDLPIRHLGFVSPSLLRLLYERALALTFFSEYEGFGIPILEAFTVGTPVVCSNTASLPEVAGDAALMCDPTDVEAVSELLERVAGDAELRARLAELGRKRIAEYSWEKAAESLSAGIDRVLERAWLPRLGEEPLVSIVTPSFNQGQFIRATIDSVLDQTYQNIEYVVVDGGSTDSTLDILREYGARIRWTSEPDSGQTHAINKGLQEARGEIVAYLNSDDVLLPDAVATVVDYLRGHPACDLVYGDADIIDAAGRVIGRYPTADYTFDRLMQNCCICQPAAFWRAAVADKVGSLDESLDYAMDFDYWIRVDRSGFEIHHVPRTIAQSREHVHAKTLTSRPAIYHEIVAVSRRSGGYVSSGYIQGLWHHLTYERPRNVARVLRPFPGLRWRLAILHHHWLNRKQYARRQWLKGGVAAAKGWLIRVISHVPPLLALAVRMKRAARLALSATRSAALRALSAIKSASRRPEAARVPPESARRLRVSGFWPDNWVSEQLDVVVGRRDQTSELRMVGWPIAGMTLEVSANGNRLGRFELEGSREEAVVVQLPPGPPETVSFRFSDAVVDTAGRTVSFRLNETNMFGEEDLVTRV
jgi:glycosyltransferase involved in cell wall biosynthesis